MMLTRTPAQHHDYNIKLTREELLELNAFGPAWSVLSRLVEREAEKIGGRQEQS